MDTRPVFWNTEPQYSEVGGVRNGLIIDAEFRICYGVGALFRGSFKSVSEADFLGTHSNPRAGRYCFATWMTHWRASCKSFMEPVGVHGVRSSAYRPSRRLGIAVNRGGRSFLPMLNGRADITEPCGVPLGIVWKVRNGRSRFLLLQCDWLAMRQ